MAHVVQDTVQPFLYRFSHVLHHEDVTVDRQCQSSLPVVASFLALWSDPDILCQFFQCPVLARQLHLRTQPYAWIWSSIYRCTATGSEFPLKWSIPNERKEHLMPAQLSMLGGNVATS